MFLTSLLLVKENYVQYVDDAQKLILNYERENGFIGEEKYTNYVNADSTANAMMAFSAIGDVNQSYRIYSLLIQNFETENSGLCAGHLCVRRHALRSAGLVPHYQYRGQGADGARTAEYLLHRPVALRRETAFLQTELHRLPHGKGLYERLPHPSGVSGNGNRMDRGPRRLAVH